MTLACVQLQKTNKDAHIFTLILNYSTSGPVYVRQVDGCVLTAGLVAILNVVAST